MISQLVFSEIEFIIKLSLPCLPLKPVPKITISLSMSCKFSKSFNKISFSTFQSDTFSFLSILMLLKYSIPLKVTEKNFSPCVVGLVTEAERLYDLRKNRLNSLKEDQNSEYVNIDKIRDELNSSKKIFKENNWPTIDVTRKSVEETAASVIKIYEIKNKKNA